MNKGGTTSGGDDEQRGGMGAQQAAAGRLQCQRVVEAALLAIESADAPKSKIPKENSPVLYELPTCYQSVAVVSIS